MTGIIHIPHGSSGSSGYRCIRVIHVVQHNSCTGRITAPGIFHLSTAWKWHIHLVSSSDSFINRVRIHSPSPPWHRKTWPGKGQPSHSGDAVQTGFSVCTGGPVWERYSGLVLFGLELACAGFLTFDLHFLRCLFRHGIIVWENEKAVLPEIGERLGKDADGQRPFENKKPGFSRLLRLKKSRLIHKW